MPGWITECGELWKAIGGTSPNWGRLAGELGRVRRETGASPEVIQHHWKEYLHRTPLGYWSPTRFRETFKYWDPGIRHRLDIEKQLDRQMREKERTVGTRQEGGLGKLSVDIDAFKAAGA